MSLGEVNRERIQLLVDALRSGEFRQTKGQLARNGSYCCLGVACVVAQRHGLNTLRDWTDESGTVFFGTDLDEPAHELLPDSVKNWYGFSFNDPEVDRDDDERDGLTTAVDFNDAGKNFNWIADAFERTFLRDGDVG